MKMMMFIMGMLLGSGLVLLVEELQFQNWLRHEFKTKEAQDQALTLTAECTCTEDEAGSFPGQHAYYCKKVEQ